MSKNTECKAQEGVLYRNRNNRMCRRFDEKKLMTKEKERNDTSLYRLKMTKKREHSFGDLVSNDDEVKLHEIFT